MKKPKISVLMACYNHEAFVGKTIESVLRQTYSDFEFRIIDDCSKDKSAEVIRQYSDERIIFTASDRNQGAIAVFNKLLQQSRGEYIAFIGSDDVWKEEKLEKQIKILEENKDIAACFTWMEWIDEYGKLYKSEEKLVPMDLFKKANCSKEQHLRELFDDQNYLGHPSAVVRRVIADQIGDFDIRLWQTHDLDWWIKICMNWNIYIVQETMVYYRRSRKGNSLSTVTINSEARTRHEFEFIFLRMFRNIGKKEFIKAFSDRIRNKNMTDEELICEKFFVLRNWNHWSTYHSRQPALEFLSPYILNESVRECLEREYSYTLKDYYNDNASLREIYPIEYYDGYRRLQKQCEEQVKQIQKIHEDYRSTLSWKITKPIRLTKKIMKRIIRI